MQPITQVLEDVKVLHQTMLGRPAPELGPQSYVPFPVGVDPVQHALLEAERLEELTKRVAAAPKPVAWTPIADCFTTVDEFVVRLDVPGILREDLKVFVIGGEVVVRGERKPFVPDEKTRPLNIERPFGAFERRFVLPTGCRVDEMKARALEGVLELRIPLEELDVRKEREFKVS